MKKVVIVSACRTAIGAFGGTLKDVPAAELGALVVKEAVSRAGIKPEQVDEVIFGNFKGGASNRDNSCDNQYRVRFRSEECGHGSQPDPCRRI
mgnify:CR=1 FL=1